VTENIQKLEIDLEDSRNKQEAHMPGVCKGSGLRKDDQKDRKWLGHIKPKMFAT
jgi:hypothetical protein